MPWNSGIDGLPGEVLRQFALGLNEVLSSLCAKGVVEKYAFVGDMAHRFLASASQGRDGVYHSSNPGVPILQDVPWPHPTNINRNGTVKGFCLQCKLELTSPTESDCSAFEAGLAGIAESPAASAGDREESDFEHWHHTRKTEYDRTVPSTSTYVFKRSLGFMHAFCVTWETAAYPPWTASGLPYPANAYVRWPTTIQLAVDFGDALRALPVPHQETAFLNDVLEESKSKGKGKA
ncbi:hypothetical protein R3P38DRAFT_2763753 [Favolaschia claudopus]|uniref:Uncharacterized protein n=1 Tax=Favolaschia claudopus TaxID=2862362 RepID=A0AAW0DCU4_9AGAR